MVRIKHRYLLLDIVFPNTSTSTQDLPPSVSINNSCPKWFDTGSLMRLIRANVSENFGDYGAGVIGGSLAIKYFSQATSTAIVRCPRAHYRIVWAALTLSDHLGRYAGRNRDDQREACVFRVVRVSGTIKKAEEEAIRRARRQIMAAQAEDGNAIDALFEGGIEDEDGDEGSEEVDGVDEDMESD